PTGPTADAGPDQTLKLPTASVILTGAATNTSGAVTYQWTKKSGGAATLLNQTTNVLTLQDLVEGSYVFELRATDAVSFDFDVVNVTVLSATINQNPVANAGPDQTVTLPNTGFDIAGVGTDADGTVTGYTWTKTSGPAVTMTNTTTPTLHLAGLVQGV